VHAVQPAYQFIAILTCTLLSVQREYLCPDYLSDLLLVCSHWLPDVLFDIMQCCESQEDMHCADCAHVVLDQAACWVSVSAWCLCRTAPCSMHHRGICGCMAWLMTDCALAAGVWYLLCAQAYGVALVALAGVGAGTSIVFSAMIEAGVVTLPTMTQAFDLPHYTAHCCCCCCAGEYLMALPQQLEVLMGDEAAACILWVCKCMSLLLLLCRRVPHGAAAAVGGADGR
jgi:hypothetical protein